MNPGNLKVGDAVRILGCDRQTVLNTGRIVREDKTAFVVCRSGCHGTRRYGKRSLRSLVSSGPAATYLSKP